MHLVNLTDDETDATNKKPICICCSSCSALSCSCSCKEPAGRMHSEENEAGNGNGGRKLNYESAVASVSKVVDHEVEARL